MYNGKVSMVTLRKARDQMEERLESRVTDLERRITYIEENVAANTIIADKRFLGQEYLIAANSGKIDGAFDRLDAFKRDVNKRFDAVDKRFEEVDRRFDAVDKRLLSLERGQSDLLANQKDLRNYMLERMDRVQEYMVERMDRDRAETKADLAEISNTLARIVQRLETRTSDE